MEEKEEASMPAYIRVRLQQEEQSMCQAEAYLNNLLQRLQRIEQRFPSLRPDFADAKAYIPVQDREVKALETSEIENVSSEDVEVSELENLSLLDNENTLIMKEPSSEFARDVSSASTETFTTPISNSTTKINIHGTPKWMTPQSYPATKTKTKNLIKERSNRFPTRPSFIPPTMELKPQLSSGDMSTGHNSVASSTFGEGLCEVFNQALRDHHGDSGRYTGVVCRSTGQPHGIGRMIYDSQGDETATSCQRIYEGNWWYGRWHGYGRAIFSNGDYFYGNYRRNVRHGSGKYVWADGRRYEGEFVDDKRQGKGVYIWANGAKYEGDFQDGLRHGHGKYLFPDGGMYKGSWVRGRYEGYGGKLILVKHCNITKEYILSHVLMTYIYI
jgi:hypothetical protein